MNEAVSSVNGLVNKEAKVTDSANLRGLFKTQKIFLRGESDAYETFRYQYGLSSNLQHGYMQPAAIIYPQPGTANDDIKAAIIYAKDNALRIAIRTGGHQCSGASSTYGPNILLDLSQAYLDDFDADANTGIVRMGISFDLWTLNEKLGKLGLFVPHGQCSHVHAGGHAQTGGYGQLGRSFGLLADHITQIEVITADGEERMASRDATEKEEQDLFYAVLGGSPGNFAVLTHIKLQMHKDSDHPNSRGMKAITLYNKDKVLQLSRLIAEMSDNQNFPGDFDFSMNVLSAASVILPHYTGPNLDERQLLKSLLHAEDRKEIFGDVEQMPAWPAALVIYLQWANLGGAAQSFDPSFFDRVKAACGFHVEEINAKKPTPMSTLTRAWIFTNVREFNLPYEKRSYMSSSTTLRKDKWPELVAQQIDRLQSDRSNGCKLICQLFAYGGANSAFRTKADDRMSFSWRDSNIILVMDCFYDDEDLLAKLASRNPRQLALAWQAQNDEVMKGPTSCFSRQDRRMLWASYGDYSKGDFNMGNAWRYYHDSQAKYNRLCAIKQKLDPQGIFTPNTFCVGVPPQPASISIAPAEAPRTLPVSPEKLDSTMGPHLARYFANKSQAP